MSHCLKLVLLGVLVAVFSAAPADDTTKVECYKNCVIYDKITRAGKEVELTAEQSRFLLLDFETIDYLSG